MQKDNKPKKIARLLGAGAVLLLLGVTARLLLSKTAAEQAETEAAATRLDSEQVYGEQAMTPEAAARIDRLKSLAKGLKRTTEKYDADEAAAGSSPKDTKNLLQNVPRFQSEKTNDTDKNPDLAETPTATYKVRDISSRETLIEGLDRLGNKENRQRIRDLLKQKQAQATKENGTETE